MQVLGSKRPKTAHGCQNQAQEKPPEDEHEDDGRLWPPFRPSLEFTEENVDRSASISLHPHKGQQT